MNENTNLLVLNQQGNLSLIDTTSLVMNELKDRVLQRRKTLGLTQKQLAKLAGVKQQSIQQLEDGLVKRPRYLLELAKALQCNAEWLSAGTGLMVTSAEDRHRAAVMHHFEGNDELEFFGRMDAWDSNTPLDEDEVELPLFREVELAAGAGATQVIENHGAKLRFAKSTLSRAGVPAEAAACAFVRGNSMEPVMPDGTCVGVNTADKTIKDGEIYAIDHGGMLRVKYLHRRPGGGIKIVSQNAGEHPVEEVAADEMASTVRVIGRVFWWSVLR